MPTDVHIIDPGSIASTRLGKPYDDYPRSVTMLCINGIFLSHAGVLVRRRLTHFVSPTGVHIFTTYDEDVILKFGIDRIENVQKVLQTRRRG